MSPYHPQSYCLKVKEMDDEEYTYTALSEPLYRVETGNYEYRLVLRCRQEARKRFAALRSDVLVKMELLDQKHVQNVATQVIRVIAALGKFNTTCAGHLDSGSLAFPIELDLSKTSCLRLPETAAEDGEQYLSTSPETAMGNNNNNKGFGVYRDDVEGEDDDDDEVDPELADEATSLLTAKERAEANGLLERSAGGSYFTADDQQVVEGKITTTAANKEQNGKGPVSLIDIFGELELKSEKEENDDDDEGKKKSNKKDDSLLMF